MKNNIKQRYLFYTYYPSGRRYQVLEMQDTSESLDWIEMQVDELQTTRFDGFTSEQLKTLKSKGVLITRG